MAVTQDHIDRLNEAIASAERQVVLDGQSITYRSIDELKAARDDMVKQLNRAAVAAEPTALPRPKQWGAYHNRVV